MARERWGSSAKSLEVNHQTTAQDLSLLDLDASIIGNINGQQQIIYSQLRLAHAHQHVIKDRITHGGAPTQLSRLLDTPASTFTTVRSSGTCSKQQEL